MEEKKETPCRRAIHSSDPQPPIRKKTNAVKTAMQLVEHVAKRDKANSTPKPSEQLFFGRCRCGRRRGQQHKMALARPTWKKATERRPVVEAHIKNSDVSFMEGAPAFSAR